MKYQVFEYKLVHAFYYYRNESYLGIPAYRIDIDF